MKFWEVILFALKSRTADCQLKEKRVRFLVLWYRSPQYILKKMLKCKNGSGNVLVEIQRVPVLTCFWLITSSVKLDQLLLAYTLLTFAVIYYFTIRTSYVLLKAWISNQVFMHVWSPTLSKHMNLFHREKCLTIARGCRKYSIYSYHICTFDDNNTVCYQRNMPKSSRLLEIHFCTAGVCNPTCYQHCRVAQIILPPQRYQGESSEPCHVYMVLMQEFVFHKMEFKLIQGLAFAPATTGSNVISISWQHSDLCKTRPWARIPLAHTPAFPHPHSTVFLEQFLEPFQITLSQPLFLRSDQLTSANLTTWGYLEITCCPKLPCSNFYPWLHSLLWKAAYKKLNAV